MTKPTNVLAFLVLILIVTSCATAHKDYSYMNKDDYRNKPQLTESLINSSEPLNETSIQKILDSKVALPKNINLAVVRLADSESGLSFQTVDQDIADQFYKTVNWGNRVQSIIPLPQVMLAKPVTLTSLRQAAVLLQADALLIIKPISMSDWKHQWFDATKAKAQTSLELLLLDTRTSVVPYTSLISSEVEVSKNDSDYDTQELLMRAKRESEKKAFLQIPTALQKFISTAL